MFSDAFREWWKRPFDPQGSVINWALFVLLILVLIGVWQSVLRYARPLAGV